MFSLFNVLQQTFQDLLYIHPASATIPVCLGEWSATRLLNTTPRIFLMSVQESFFYEDIKFMLSKFHVDFCSEGFSFSLMFFLASSLTEESIFNTARATDHSSKGKKYC